MSGVTTRIVLVRHAQSVWPRLGEPDDDQRPLTSAGLVQAEELVSRLVEFSPVAVLSSPQLRAVQTVTPAASALVGQHQHHGRIGCRHAVREHERRRCQ